MDKMTLVLPQVGICDSRDPARLLQSKTHSSPNNRVWAWSPLTSLSKNWSGEQAGSEPAHIASYSPQAPGEKNRATLSPSKFPSGQ